MRDPGGAQTRTAIDTTGAWWQLMLAGPCLLAVVVMSAMAGLEAWLLGMFVIILAIVLTGLGAILGLWRLNTRRTETSRT